MKSASTTVELLEGLNSGRKPEDRLSGELPLLASRTVGKGRIAVFAVTPTYLFAEVGRTTLDGILYDRGLHNLPSHGAVMFENALRWLAEPTAADAAFGGAAMNEHLLDNPQKTKFGAPWNWAKRNSSRRPTTCRSCPA